MLKNKLKILLILLMVFCITLSPLSFADDETITENTQEEVQITEEDTNTENLEVDENLEPGSENTENLPVEDNTTHEDKYVIGDSVVIDNIIDGNLFVIANNVTIKNQIIGNAFICAQNVNITDQGYISNSLYVATNDLQITGIVYDIYAVSNNAKLSGYIYRDLHIATDTIDLLTTVGRNASITAKNMNFTNKESQEASNEENTTPIVSAQIIGNLDYSSESEITIPEGIVSGKITYSNSSLSLIKTNSIMSMIYFTLFVIALFGIYKWLAPKFLKNSGNLITAKPFKTIGLGILTLVALPVISVLLLMIKVTSTVGLFLLAINLVLLFASKATFIIALNNVIAKKLKFEKTLKTFLLLIPTTIAIKLLSIIPYVGIVLSIVCIIIGAGIIVRSIIFKKELDVE